MAIAFGASSSSGFLNSTTNNFSYIQAAGDNRLLVIYVYSGGDFVTNVTFNGVGATFINKRLMTGAAAGQYINMWYLIAPDVTTANIVVTSSSNLSGYITAVSYTGVLQESQPDVSGTNGSDSTTALTTTLTTTVDNAWIMGFAYHNSAVLAGTNTTLRGASVNVLASFDTNADQTPAGNHSVQTTVASADFAGHVTAAFKPFVSTPTFTPKIPTLLTLGVG